MTRPSPQQAEGGLQPKAGAEPKCVNFDSGQVKVARFEADFYGGAFPGQLDRPAPAPLVARGGCEGCDCGNFHCWRARKQVTASEAPLCLS